MLLGAGWLIMKTEGELQEQAVALGAASPGLPMVVGMVLISLATPWVSATVRERWFALPEFIALLADPADDRRRAARGARRCSTRARCAAPLCWLPFVLLIVVFVLGFLGLAYSIYPYVVIDRLTIWQAASARRR